jgi:hypothetical protein
MKDLNIFTFKHKQGKSVFTPVFIDEKRKIAVELMPWPQQRPHLLCYR